MFGKYFTYDGRSSEEFHVMIAGFSSSVSVPMGLNRELLTGSQNRFRTSPNHMGAVNSEVLSFDISFIKDPCVYTKTEEAVFTEDEIDELNAWLTSPDYPLLFNMYEYDEEPDKKYDYFGVFENVETETMGELVMGLKYKFTTNSPYAWSNLKVKEFACSGTTSININVKTSERKQPIYPVITIIPNYFSGSLGRQTITITNRTDGNKSLTMNIVKAQLVIDTQKAMITDTANLISFDDLGIGDMDYIYWPRLYNGNNEIVINGDATVKFEYREPRKVGAY